MASSSTLVSQNLVKQCTVEATVPTGFESVASEEVEETFQTKCSLTRGKIKFAIPQERVKDILDLGGIDHCQVQILHVPCFNFTPDAADCLARLQLLVRDSNWAVGLGVWRQFHSFLYPISSKPISPQTDEQLVNVCYSVHFPSNHQSDMVTDMEKTDTVVQDRLHKQNREKAPRDPTRPTFRVTCNRSGENHSFDSTSAAASFGSAVQTYFNWQVDMKRFDIEIVLNIDGEDVSVGIALTSESLHKRDLVAFGVTTLRPTICYNMLRMVGIKQGHIVCDPLCGTGSISVQGSLRFSALQLCGDNHKIAMEKTASNRDGVNLKQMAAGRGGLTMDALRWDASCLPLRNGVIDAFVSDLPFGKRVGKRSENLNLYSKVMKEMARCSTSTGRAALLTADIHNMKKALKAQKYWSKLRCCRCNIGGIGAVVFLLQRTVLPYIS